ncbi:hypothetical protein [Deinococcus peraridilitoris]|uniref:Uncharacterized protein n=1 Tax=Deinococcus peraridilitoris (strain DSM 19664 / LMG 22246 / CIP 109416 / KR-200) TaxID=937777 RepID=L0A2X6_DEIPD|nr:hypothetical protein [Deinococcus peraridilitoris]AFZ67537.1 hypothetical protein Deipe_2041 [Deinococcus peraridilitoris DSM 19664]
MIQELVQGKLEEFQDLGYIGHLEPVQFDGESLTATAYIPREHWNRQDRQRILSALTDLEDEHDITVEVRLTREREHAPGE